MVVARLRYWSAVLALGASACFVGVKDVEDPAAGGSGGAAGSGGNVGGGTGGSGGSTTGGAAGAETGGASGSGGAAGSSTGGVGGTGGASNGGTGGATTDTCGDKVLSASSEECDDGNQTSGDGCSGECKVECSETAGEYVLPNKHCYRGVKDLLNWDAAKAVCVAWHGNLISILGDEEVTMSHKIGESIGTPAWIGLNDQVTEGSYAWSDGTTFAKPNWEPGEPNDVIHIENCVVLAGNNAGTSYSWYDEPCQMPYRAICERAAGVP